ncbi:MAG: hypothetical protein ACOH5I_06770 [Oligoflexus sp.]
MKKSRMIANGVFIMLLPLLSLWACSDVTASFNTVKASGFEADVALNGEGEGKAENNSEDLVENGQVEDVQNGATIAVNDDDLNQCSSFFGKELLGVNISGNKNEIEFRPSEAFAAYITGNQNRLTFNLGSENSRLVEFEGFCLKLTGNKPVVNATVSGVKVGKVRIIASGNSPTVNIYLLKGASIESFESDEKGNRPNIQIETL